MDHRPEEIALKLQSGDAGEIRAAAAELEELFAAHREQLQRQCRRLVDNEQVALEIAQEAMLIAYGKLHTFRVGESFGAWLFGIARNLAWRSNRKKKELLFEDGVLEQSDPAAGAVTLLMREQRSDLLERAARGLSELERQAVRLRYLEGKSRSEIEVLLELDGSSGARGLLQRCRRKLSKQLAEELALVGHGDSFFRTL